MSFPFSAATQQLRQRIMLAVGAGGILGISAVAGCGDSGPPSCDDDKPAAKTCLTRSQMEERARRLCGDGPQSTCRERSAAEMAALFDDSSCLIPSEVQDGCCNAAAKSGDPQSDGSCCYYHCTAHNCCGRPLLVAGAARLARVQVRADWLAGGIAGPLQQLDQVQARIACEWRQDARMEHASVAAFARFSLELLGFAAPADLVSDAQLSGLDEVAHARACFSLAQRYDGAACGPGRLDLQGVTPAGSLPEAVGCVFLEGCVGETQAALLARQALQLARDPAVREALEQISQDEARHALLAWRFIAWALREDASCAVALQAALEQALAAAPSKQQLELELEPSDTRARLHAAGRLTAKERATVAHAALREVIVPCARALLQAAPAVEARAAV